MKNEWNSFQEDLSKIYKAISKQVHPDHGGNESDMKKLNEAYTVFRSIIKKYDGTNNLNVNFRFPYPNYDFRVEDRVFINDDSEHKIGLITKIKKINDSCYEFDVKFNDDDKIKKYIRKSLKCSEDPKFYLYSARWDYESY